MLRRLAFVAPLFLCFATCASVCDPFPDECEDDDNVCDGNVANICEQPVPEARRMTTREDCGPTRACVLHATVGRPVPVCARGGAAECPSEKDVSCFDDRTRSECIRTSDGRLVWLDTACPDGFVCSDKACRPRQ